MKSVRVLVALFVFSAIAYGQSSKLDRAVQRGVSESWNDVSVATDGNGWMWIVTTQRAVNDQMYSLALMQACMDIDADKVRAKKLNRILVLNASKKQGFVFEKPNKCGEVINTPMGKALDLKIMSATHTYMGANEKNMTGD
jgi:hypothetical protein